MPEQGVLQGGDVPLDGDVVLERLPRKSGRARVKAWIVDARGRDLSSGPIPLNTPDRSLSEPIEVDRGRLRRSRRRTRVARRVMKASRARLLDRDSVARLLLRGLNAREVSRQLGSNYSDVIELARELGVPLRRGRPRKIESPALEDLARLADGIVLLVVPPTAADSTSFASRPAQASKHSEPVVWRMSRLGPEAVIEAFREARTLRGAAEKLGCSGARIWQILAAAKKAGHPGAQDLPTNPTGKKGYGRSPAFGARLTQLVTDAGVLRSVLARRIAAGTGRSSPEGWDKWLSRMMSGQQPSEALLLEVLGAARFKDPTGTTRWLLSDGVAPTPWPAGAAAEPEPPRQPKLKNPIRALAMKSCKERLPAFLELVGLKRMTLARHLHHSSGWSSTASLTIRLHGMEKGVVWIPEERLTAVLRAAGFTDPEGTVAWLYGRADVPPAVMLTPDAFAQAKKRVERPRRERVAHEVLKRRGERLAAIVRDVGIPCRAIARMAYEGLRSTKTLEAVYAKFLRVLNAKTDVSERQFARLLRAAGFRRPRTVAAWIYGRSDVVTWKHGWLLKDERTSRR